MFNNANYEPQQIELDKGDRLYLYTDGITETKSISGEFFGQDQLSKFLLKNNHKPMETVVDMVFEKIDQFTNYQPARDDRTLVALEVS